MRFVAALLVGIGSTLASATGAYAAERPFSWTGFYLGGTAGYARGNSQHCDSPGCPSASGGPDVDPSGWHGGVTAGYNAQYGNVVVGVEVDYSFANLKDTGPSGGLGGFGCGSGCVTEIDGFGTVRGRLGYASGKLLTYVTGGLAFTRWTGRLDVESGSETRTTAVLGGGFEYALTRNWSAKFEYLHIFDGGHFVYAPSCFPPGCGIRDLEVDLVRAGVNYRF